MENIKRQAIDKHLIAFKGYLLFKRYILSQLGRSVMVQVLTIYRSKFTMKRYQEKHWINDGFFYIIPVGSKVSQKKFHDVEYS